MNFQASTILFAGEPGETGEVRTASVALLLGLPTSRGASILLDIPPRFSYCIAFLPKLPPRGEEREPQGVLWRISGELQRNLSNACAENLTVSILKGKNTKRPCTRARTPQD